MADRAPAPPIFNLNAYSPAEIKEAVEKVGVKKTRLPPLGALYYTVQPAARATFALKAGEWFRRGRLLMVSPVHGDCRRSQAEIPLIVLSRFPEPALE
jgi:hypothetical protein